MTPGSSIDMVTYRFKANGDLDLSYGDNGAKTYDAGIGQEDRGRDINVLPDGRIVIAGSSAQGAGDLIAAVYLLRPNGQFEKTFGDGGALKVDFGGNGDAFFGLSDTASDTRAIVAGYKAVTGGLGDDAVSIRVDLNAITPPPPPAAEAPPAAAPAPGPVDKNARVGTAKLVGIVVTIPLSCQAGARCIGTVRVRSFAPVRIGSTRKVISVTRQASFRLARGKKRTVRLALSRDAKTAHEEVQAPVGQGRRRPEARQDLQQASGAEPLAAERGTIDRRTVGVRRSPSPARAPRAPGPRGGQYRTRPLS